MNPDRRRLLTALAALPALGAAPAVARARGQQTPADTALDAVFASAAPPALAAGFVTRGGLGWSDVRGVRRAGASDPALIGDRWHIGSNTKAMTAALFGRLVEQGRTRWDLTVAEAFPGIIVDPAWRDVRLTALMHHRAGLADADVIGVDWLMTARDDPRPLPEQRAALAAKAFGKPPSGAPGTFAYGNANYIVVGAAIEAITGGSWEDAMQAEVFGPLGMTSAGFGPPPDPNAWGHRAGMTGPATPMDPVDPGADNPLALGPAGTAHMTVADYARFLTVFLKQGGDWLTPGTVAVLTAPAEGPPPAYACGWIVQTPAWAGGGTVLGHEGTNTMWHAVAMVAPSRGRAVIAVSNDAREGRDATQSLAARLISIPPIAV